MRDISLNLCYNTYMNKKVCFIGHRRIGFGDIRSKLKEAVLQKLKDGCRFFTMGTHGEFDEMALSICRELRKDYPDIEIVVVITSLQKIKKELLYDDEWGKEYFIPYNDVKTTMYNIEETHYKRQIIESNHQMIDECDTVICYVNKKNSYSGAKYAWQYAKKKGKEIINLYDEKDEPTYGMTEEEKKEYYKKFWESIKKKTN